MSQNNLGRVQGGGAYYSSSTSTTSIPVSTVKATKIKPLVDDIIINANGDVLQITAVSSSAYTVSKLSSIKGATGSQGAPGSTGPAGSTGPTGAAAGFASAMEVLVDTLAAGSNATVTVEPDSSTPNTAKKFKFTFGIPRGAQGLQGSTGPQGPAGPVNVATGSTLGGVYAEMGTVSVAAGGTKTITYAHAFSSVPTLIVDTYSSSDITTSILTKTSFMILNQNSNSSHTIKYLAISH